MRYRAGKFLDQISLTYVFIYKFFKKPCIVGWSPIGPDDTLKVEPDWPIPRASRFLVNHGSGFFVVRIESCVLPALIAPL